MTFDVFTAVKIQMVFWVVTLCSFAVGYQRFRGPCCLLSQHYMASEPRRSGLQLFDGFFVYVTAPSQLRKLYSIE